MIVRGMGKIALDNFEGKKARAVLFARQFLRERQFGFWGETRGASAAAPTFGSTDVRSRESFMVLQEIQQYAGYIRRPNFSYCPFCSDKNLGSSTIQESRWQGEFAFAPLEGGYLYRWSAGMMHFHEKHDLMEPHWMAEMIKDYRLAQSRGFWKD